MDDETRWSKLDGAVYCRLHNCCSLSDRVQLLSDTIYQQAALIFGHPPLKTKNLSGHSRRTKHSIELIQQKALISSQISATCIQEEQAGLTLLLSQVKGKIKSLRRSERSRKKRWKIKQTRSAFRNDPYKAGKDLLNPKCTSTLHVDQASLDNHKARLTNDTLYDVPLTSLEGLPPPPNNIKQFPKTALKFHDFVKLLNSRRDASATGLNAIPYKVYKKCP